MPHRPGHVDGSGDGTESMDRRKYLSTLATGAALGAVAVGVASCETGESGHKDVTRQWGRITLFEPEVLTYDQADNARPKPGEQGTRIQIPFFNNTGTELKPGDIVGVHLLKIGCPIPQFVIAINIEKLADHTDMTDKEKEDYIKRFENQNKLLRYLGYDKPWASPEPPVNCPEAPEFWEYPLPDPKTVDTPVDKQ